jgi:HTH-type transcriptional regulator/antitoxin HigA
MMAEWLDFTKPHVLRDETEYQAAVDEIDHLLDADPEPASEAYERLEFLSVLVQAYEDAHFPLDDLPTPQAMVDFMLEQKGLSRADLARWLGGKSRVSEFFRGIRPLSLKQVEALREHLGIPADLLIPRAIVLSDSGVQ